MTSRARRFRSGRPASAPPAAIPRRPGCRKPRQSPAATGTLQQCTEESFAGWSETRDDDTAPRRPLPGLLRARRRRLFHVREEFANEREDHCLFSLPANPESVVSSQLPVVSLRTRQLSLELQMQPHPGNGYWTTDLVISWIIDMLQVEGKDAPCQMWAEHFDGSASQSPSRRAIRKHCIQVILMRL